MSGVHARSLAALLCLAVVGSVGCDDSGTAVHLTTTGPSPFRSSGAFVSRAVSVPSTSIHAQRIAGSLCPLQPPFFAPVSLLFQADTSDLFFTGAELQFVDRFGLHEPLRTFSRTQLIDRFGSILVPAFGSRTFGFSFPFGCVGAPAGTLAIIVIAADSFHRETRTRLDVVIR